jgi:hypothetical protein
VSLKITKVSGNIFKIIKGKDRSLNILQWTSLVKESILVLFLIRMPTLKLWRAVSILDPILPQSGKLWVVCSLISSIEHSQLKICSNKAELKIKSLKKCMNLQCFLIGVYRYNRFSSGKKLKRYDIYLNEEIGRKELHICM